MPQEFKRPFQVKGDVRTADKAERKSFQDDVPLDFDQVYIVNEKGVAEIKSGRKRVAKVYDGFFDGKFTISAYVNRQGKRRELNHEGTLGFLTFIGLTRGGLPSAAGMMHPAAETLIHRYTYSLESNPGFYAGCVAEQRAPKNNYVALGTLRVPIWLRSRDASVWYRFSRSLEEVRR